MVLVNLSNLCWSNERRRRNQAIFTHLLQCTDRFERGFFVQPPKVKKGSILEFGRKPTVATVAEFQEFGPPVTVLQPYFTLPGGESKFSAQRSVKRLAEELIAGSFGGQPYWLWINSVNYYQSRLAKTLMPLAAFRVFDSGESLMMYERNRRRSEAKSGKAILASCEAAVCANEELMARLDHPTKFLFPSGIDFGAFQKRDPEFRLDPLFPKPADAIYAGLTGSLSRERTDVNLLKALFLRFPGYQFLFVGSTSQPRTLAELKRFPNFHHMVIREGEPRATILNQLDLALIPDLENEGLRENDEVRVLEFLACGLPVIATNSRTAAKFRNLLSIAGSSWEFMRLMERAVANGAPHKPGPGMAVAQQRSWARQVRQFSTWLTENQREFPERDRARIEALALNAEALDVDV